MFNELFFDIQYARYMHRRTYGPDATRMVKIITCLSLLQLNEQDEATCLR